MIDGARRAKLGEPGHLEKLIGRPGAAWPISERADSYPPTTKEVNHAIRLNLGLTNWDTYRKCAVRGAVIGQACRSLSGWIWGGDPGGSSIPRDTPHRSRKPRSGR